MASRKDSDLSAFQTPFRFTGDFVPNVLAISCEAIAMSI